MNECLEDALAFAAKGWKVFPCYYGSKIPATRRGFLDATTDHDKIVEWFGAYKKNIGLATGKESGVVVIDYDGYKPDTLPLAVLEEKLGPLPETFKISTRAGGLHLYFNYPEGRDLRSYNGQLGKGVDVRSDGGYVLTEGARVYADKNGPDGEHTSMNCEPIADLPPAWIDAWEALNATQDALKAKKLAAEQAKAAKQAALL